MRQAYRIIPVYTADVSGVCSALYELGGMVVMHDPSGCNSTYNTHDEIRWYEQDSLIYISGLTEIDAVMGNDAKFVLDIKQAVRSKEDPMQMLKTLGSGVVHVHMSDHGEYGDCLQIGAGRFAVKSFLQMLAQLSPNCTIVLELYRSGFRTLQDLLHNDHILQRMIQSCQEKEE